jgi:hypothetical protein
MDWPFNLKSGEYGFNPQPECFSPEIFVLFFCRAATNYVFQNIPICIPAYSDVEETERIIP